MFRLANSIQNWQLMLLLVLAVVPLLSHAQINDLPVRTSSWYIFNSPERYLNNRPDTTLHYSGYPKLIILENLALEDILILREGQRRFRAKSSDIFMATDGKRVLRRVKNRQFAWVLHNEGGLTLYRKRIAGQPEFADYSCYWFSQGIAGKAHRLTRSNLREVYQDYPEFLKEVEQVFGKSDWNPFNPRLTKRGTGGECKLLQIYRKHFNQGPKPVS